MYLDRADMLCPCVTGCFRGSRTKFRRFVCVQQRVEKLAMTAIEFPTMQKGAELQSRCREGENGGSPDGNGDIKVDIFDDRHGRLRVCRPQLISQVANETGRKDASVRAVCTDENLIVRGCCKRILGRKRRGQGISKE